MGAIEEIIKMKQSGKTEEEIISSLKSFGLNQQEIGGALAQARIKEAVNQETEDIKDSNPISKEGELKKRMESSCPQYEGMQPSILSQEQQEKEEYYPQSEQYSPTPIQSQYEQPQYPQYQDYQQYQPSGISTDTITEISEQILAEKLSPIRNKIEKAIDLKNTFESKIEYIDERLKKIERIIERLQLSVLQKVGDYITNVEDIKKEIQETQKSFKALHSAHHKK